MNPFYNLISVDGIIQPQFYWFWPKFKTNEDDYLWRRNNSIPAEGAD